MPADGAARHLRAAGLALCAAVAVAGCSAGEGGRLDAGGSPSTGGEVAVAADSGDAAFCSKVVEVLGRYRDVFTNPAGTSGADGSDPSAGFDRAKEMGRRLAEPMRELADAAPAAVAPALEQMARGLEAMRAGDLGSLTTMSAQMGDAGQQFGDYVATHCQGADVGGLEAVTGAFGAPAPPTTGGTAGGGESPASGPPTSASGNRGPFAPPRPGR